MSEIAQHQLLITTVHGTWPRGFFPRLFRFKQWIRGLIGRRQPWEPPPFWFEEGSPFLARLSAELRDIPHKITRLLWSGENSISVRDKTAHRLTEHLSAEHAEHPQATQLIIAHSHGGNIALRALHLLHQPDGSRLCHTDGAGPLVVTLATPFVEVQHADFGAEPTFVRAAVFIAIWIPLWVLAKAFFPMNEFGAPLLISAAVFLVFCRFLIWYCFSKRATRRRQNHVEIRRTATQLGEIVSPQAQRLLIIRAIDDEASLVLAFSTIANYFITRAIRYIRWIIFGPVSAMLLSFIVIKYFKLSFEQEGMLKQKEWYQDAIEVVCSALILFLFGLLSIARSAHGRELARTPMECQVNTQSTPDAVGLSKIVTLVQPTYRRSRRHGIYEHEDCVKAISDWVRSQLCAMPVRQETG
jgi:hypothetical protein